MYQADHGVNRGFWRRILEISLIGHIGLILAVRQFPHSNRLRVVFCPESQPFLSQIILIIKKQFFKTRPCYSYELQLGLLGSARHHTALGDVLLAAAGRLHHLVMST